MGSQQFPTSLLVSGIPCSTLPFPAEDKHLFVRNSTHSPRTYLPRKRGYSPGTHPCTRSMTRHLEVRGTTNYFQISNDRRWSKSSPTTDDDPDSVTSQRQNTLWDEEVLASRHAHRPRTPYLRHRCHRQLARSMFSVSSGTRIPRPTVHCLVVTMLRFSHITIEKTSRLFSNVQLCRI